MPIAPSFFECRTVIHDTDVTLGPDPAYPPSMGVTAPQFHPVDRVCGTRYHEATDGPRGGATPVCACGTFAVGVCAECGAPVCGECSSRRNQRRLCPVHTAASDREQRRVADDAAAAEYESAVVSRLDELAKISEPIERLVRAVAWFRPSFPLEDSEWNYTPVEVLELKRRLAQRGVDADLVEARVRRVAVDEIGRMCADSLDSDPDGLERALVHGDRPGPWRARDIGPWLVARIPGKQIYPALVSVGSDGTLRSEGPYRIAGGATVRAIRRKVQGTRQILGYMLSDRFGVLQDGRFYNRDGVQPDMALLADDLAEIRRKLRLG
jgi:hypothetical protein